MFITEILCMFALSNQIKNGNFNAKLAQMIAVLVQTAKIKKMSELDEIIIKKVSAAIEKAAETYSQPTIIKGVAAICKYLQVSRNTFYANYLRGDYGNAVRKISQMYYLNPVKLFEK